MHPLFYKRKEIGSDPELNQKYKDRIHLFEKTDIRDFAKEKRSYLLKAAKDNLPHLRVMRI